MKILYVVTVGSTMGFFNQLIKELINDGNIVDIACSCTDAVQLNEFRDWGCKVFPLSCSRTPLNKGNIDTIKEIRKLVRAGKYDIVHCHTPIAAACARLACRPLRKNGLSVLYTAHGFHFFTGAPLKKWLLYYPIEWVCSYWTDLIITINEEDYLRSSKKLHARNVKYVPGVGIDIEKFSLCKKTKTEKRKELMIPEDTLVFLSVGELSKRKNHELVIRALRKLNDTKWIYLIAGECSPESQLEDILDKYSLKDNVKLLGRRNDIRELCECADLFILPSYQEGLSVALMEAVASKIPVIASRIRGSRELVQEGQLFSPYSEEELFDRIQYVMGQDEKQKMQLINRNYENLRNFSINRVNEIMRGIYSKYGTRC